MWLIAVIAFVAGYALCSLAWSTESLIGFWIRQGLGCGILPPVGTTIIVKAAGSKQTGRAIALMGMPLLLGMRNTFCGNLSTIAGLACTGSFGPSLLAVMPRY